MMRNERYTSPALSRSLAAAGLEQKGETFWCECNTLAEPHVTRAPWSHRALDLTDVLAEIEARGATWLVETDHGTYCATAVLNPTFSAVMGGPSAAEAAGLCLLALMDKERERAKP